MLVVTKNGEEEFNPSKLQQSIIKAFRDYGYVLTPKDSREISNFCQSFNPKLRSIEAKTLQDEVEQFLITHPRWYKVGKALIIQNARKNEMVE